MTAEKVIEELKTYLCYKQHDCIDGFCKDGCPVDNAIQTIRELQEQNKWHYCKDELPPKRQDILVVLRDGDMSTGYLSDEYFYVDCMSNKYVEIRNVIAWRELPKFEEVE